MHSLHTTDDMRIIEQIPNTKITEKRRKMIEENKRKTKTTRRYKKTRGRKKTKGRSRRRMEELKEERRNIVKQEKEKQ